MSPAQSLPTNVTVNLEDDGTGSIVDAGLYWVWRPQPAPSSGRRLFQAVGDRVAEIPVTTSMHVVPAGTEHLIGGLFDLWLTADIDHIWTQIERGDGVTDVLVSGGQVGANRTHRVRMRCQGCATPLGEPIHLDHQATPETFVTALASAVARLNAAHAGAPCPRCGDVQPPACDHPLTVSRPTTTQSVVPTDDRPLTPQHRSIRVPISDDLRAGHAVSVNAGDIEIVIATVDGTFCAIEGRCPHRGAPLGGAEIESNELTCPWHHHRFDLTSGRSTTSERFHLTRYELTVRDDTIIVEI